MKRYLIWIFVLPLLFVTGCLGKQLPYKDIRPEAGKAVIYVYRPASFINSAETMILEVDGDEIGYLSHSLHLYTIVTPGNHLLRLKKNVVPYNEYGQIKLTNLKAGKTYYVKADPVAFGGFDMILMNEEQGRSEAMQTKYFVNE